MDATPRRVPDSPLHHPSLCPRPQVDKEMRLASEDLMERKRLQRQEESRALNEQDRAEVAAYIAGKSHMELLGITCEPYQVTKQVVDRHAKKTKADLPEVWRSLP